MIEPTPSPVPPTVIVVLAFARMPPLSRRRSRKALRTRLPPVWKVSELSTVDVTPATPAPSVTFAALTRVLVLTVTVAAAAGVLISVLTFNGRTPLVASQVANCAVSAVPMLPTRTSATAQGMMRIVAVLVAVDPTITW